MHIHSHTNLPDPLTEGNARADHLTMSIISNQTFTAASESHVFFHQNTGALSKDYDISISQACIIVNACPDCQGFSSPNVPSGVVRSGLAASQLGKLMLCTFRPLAGRNLFIVLLTYFQAF